MNIATASKRRGNEFTHYTPRGVFRIVMCPRLGVPGWELWYDDRLLGWSTYADLAIEPLRAGYYNEKLGFDAREINVPLDAYEWNNFR